MIQTEVEMDKYGKVFENIATIMNFYLTNTNIKDDDVLNYLSKKLLLDLYSIEKLLSNERDNRCLLQAYTVARSMIESSVNFMYLLFYEEERQQYLDDSQLLLFKNEFIMINTIIKYDFKKMIKNKKFNFEALCNAIETVSFNKLTNNNQKRLLNVLRTKNFKITEQSVKLLNIFFTKKFKPMHSNIEQMFIKLRNKIKYEGNERMDLRVTCFQDYNEASQFLHGIYPIRRPELHNLIRLCCNIFNNIGASIRTVYKLKIPIEIHRLVLDSYMLLHNEEEQFK